MKLERKAEWFEQLDRVLAHTFHWDDFEADYGTPTPIAMISTLRSEIDRLEGLVREAHQLAYTDKYTNPHWFCVVCGNVYIVDALTTQARFARSNELHAAHVEALIRGDQ